jgi:polygalacturonase
MRIITPMVSALAALALALHATPPAAAQATSYPSLPSIPDRTFVITTYGAVGNGTTDNTTAIQNTINACSTAGGGTVVVPTGVYLSGPLTLKSNVNIDIGSGATLRLLPYGAYPGTNNTYPSFLNGGGVTDVMISGSGTIDGQGQAWWDAVWAGVSFKRPALISFSGCTRVAVTGITLLNAPNAHISISQGTSHSSIVGVTFSSPSDSPNTDGIDIWGPNVLVSGCTLNCGDDNIALDSGSSTGAANLTISHCDFGTGHGMSIGSYTGGPAGIGELTVEECSFNGATPIRMKSSRTRGGLTENLLYKNISGANFGRAIFISSYYPDNTIPATYDADPAQSITSTTPFWTNIKVNHFTATNVTNEAALIVGLPEAPVTNLIMNDVRITAPKGMRLWHAGNVALTGSTINAGSGAAVITGDATYSTGTAETDVNLTTAPGLRTLTRGASTAYTANITSFGGLTGAVMLAVTGLPTGASATFSPATVTTAGTSTLTITTTTSTPLGIYPLKVTATNGSYSAYSTIVLKVIPVLAINSGGTAAGAYGADGSYTGGSTYATGATIDTSGATSPAPQTVYQTERYGNFAYTIGNLVPGANYTVRLHFAELYWGATGKRTFNVSINGTQTLAAFDIYAVAGAKNKAVVREFDATASAVGQITVQYTSITDNAKSSGIELIKQ